jgi:hypothetical protein
MASDAQAIQRTIRSPSFEFLGFSNEFHYTISCIIFTSERKGASSAAVVSQKTILKKSEPNLWQTMKTIKSTPLYKVSVFER